jgi:hypothetical protein
MSSVRVAPHRTLAVQPRARSAVVEATARPRATLHEGANKLDEGDSIGATRGSVAEDRTAYESLLRLVGFRFHRALPSGDPLIESHRKTVR